MFERGVGEKHTLFFGAGQERLPSDEHRRKEGSQGVQMAKADGMRLVERVEVVHWLVEGRDRDAGHPKT